MEFFNQLTYDTLYGTLVFAEDTLSQKYSHLNIDSFVEKVALRF